MQKIIDSKYQFLDGPNSRGSELRFSLKVMIQLLKGFRSLHFIGPAITVFGSARTEEDHNYYKIAYDIGKKIADLGFTTMTGGGPGIMEAANRGAFENNGKSIGCSIKLPKEQSENKFMHKSVIFDHFFVRKVLLLKYSYAFIVLPGGFGTIDELFETLTLIQTGIINDFPVVVFGDKYYSKIKEMINKMIDEKTISAKDNKLVLFTDDIEEGFRHITKYISSNYKINNKKTTPFWWLGETKRIRH